MNRQQQILDAADHLTGTYDRWLDKTPDNVPPTAAVEEAAEAFISVCARGDVPAACRNLISAAGRFSPLWRAYTQGDHGPGHQPRREVWEAMEAVRRAATGIKTFRPKPKESVRDLLAQGVTPKQIASHIFGHNDTGPLLRNGVVDMEMIAKEKAEPWTVIPRDWVHPTEASIVSQEFVDAQTSIVAAEESRAVVGDPDGIEGMLRGGAYPNQVANVFGIPLEEVLQVAQDLGITPNSMPNLAGERAPHEPNISKESIASARPAFSPDSQPQTETESGTATATLDNPWSEEEIRELVVSTAEANSELGPKELSALILSQGGPDIHTNKVAVILRKK